MSQEHTAFVARSSSLLASVIHRAILGEIPPQEVRKAADSILSSWDAAKASAPSIPTKGENELWCAVWTAQHLGDKEHWEDGIAPRDLQKLLPALEGSGTLPNGWRGDRP